MTHEAPRPTLALVQEDGLDARPEKFEIERRNSSGGRGSLLRGRNIQRTDDEHGGRDQKRGSGHGGVLSFRHALYRPARRHVNCVESGRA